MFITLGDEFSSLGRDDWDGYREMLDCLLVAHSQGSHLLSLSPRQIFAITENVNLAGLSKRIMGIIQKRSNDYNIARGFARRIIVVRDPAIIGSCVLQGGQLMVPATEIGTRWLTSRPGLFVENATNDGRFYEILTRGFLHSERSPKDYFAVRAQHGGGTGLVDVVRAATAELIKGACICDRDSRVPCPPFRGMARAVHSALQELGVVEGEQMGMSTSHPYFGWAFPNARSLENLVGPHLLDLFFASERTSFGLRASISEAFTSFPILSDDEMVLWINKNQKEGELDSGGNVDDGALSEMFHAATGRLPPWTPEKLRRMAAVSIPQAVIRWVGVEGRARRERQIRDAISRDLSSRHYFNAFGEIPYLIRDLLAADPAIPHS